MIIRSAEIVCATLFLGVFCFGAKKDEVVATGNLERIMDRSISIRRADGVLIEARLLHTGKLRADVLAAKYHLGDIVEITCKSIPPAFDDDAHMFRVLELTNFQLLRSPSAEEYFQIITSRAWREPGNLLKPPRAEQIPRLDAAERAVTGPPEEQKNLEWARGVNLRYLAALPSFAADETATRYTTDQNPPKWRPLDVIASDVTFKRDVEIWDQVFANNRLVPGGIKDVKGLHWNGAFGARIRALFDPECPVTFKFTERTAVRGRQALIFDFRAPPESCFEASSYSYLRFFPGRTGKVYIDASTGNVLQVDEKATVFPKGYVFSEMDRQAVWDNVKVGDASHLLPVSADEIVRYTSGQLEWVNLKYTNVKNYEAAQAVAPK